METFLIDEVAMIVGGQSNTMNGREVTVVGIIRNYTHSSAGFHKIVRFYLVKFDGEDAIHRVVPENLSKLHDKNNVVEWRNIEHIFKPDRSIK